MNQIPTYAMGAFLEIIHTYGSFLKEREVVKNINKNTISKQINREINQHSKDYYSWEYREHGISSGISDSELKSLNNTVNTLTSEQKDLLTKNLISTEKFFKKLKHQFNEKYPELKDILKDAISEHQKFIENNKRERYQLKNEIISLSPSFISFFHYHFGGCEGQKIAYHPFSSAMERKYNVTPDSPIINTLYCEIDSELRKPRTVLSLEEITLLGLILKNLVNNITEEDLKNGRKYINDTEGGNLTIDEKVEVANEIINKNFNRFKKLHYKYEELKEKM